MEIPKFEHFTLVAASLLRDEGVSIRYILELAEEGEVNNIYSNDDCTMEPSEAMKEAFNELKPTLARVYKFDSFRTIVQSKEFKASKDQSQILEKHYQDLMRKITVKTVTLKNWDTEDNKLVSISGVFEDDYKHELPIKTKDILLSQTKLGTEADIQHACEEIRKEAYKYRFEGKKAQPGLFDAKKPEKNNQSQGKVVEMGSNKTSKVAAQ